MAKALTLAAKRQTALYFARQAFSLRYMRGIEHPHLSKLSQQPGGVARWLYTHEMPCGERVEIIVRRMKTSPGSCTLDNGATKRRAAYIDRLHDDTASESHTRRLAREAVLHARLALDSDAADALQQVAHAARLAVIAKHTAERIADFSDVI